MEGVLVGFWATLEGCWDATHKRPFRSSVNRWSIKRSPNGTKLDRRSTGSKPTPDDKSRSNPKMFNTRTRKEVVRDTRWHRSAGLQNGQRGKCSDAWDEHVCKCDAHDDMIWDAWHASNDKATTANNWKSSAASVSGRYNTPPLREDLVPRSRTERTPDILNGGGIR